MSTPAQVKDERVNRFGDFRRQVAYLAEREWLPSNPDRHEPKDTDEK